MQLPLNLILAYLDNILDQDQRRQVELILSRDPDQTQLLHRISDLMRRGRLGAPDLWDEEGLDPNSVAEYLDQTLDTQQLNDFQQFCIESDVHLAESAAVHQILAIVLGEPAIVPPESRHRMYKIVQCIEPLSQQTATPSGHESVDAPLNAPEDMPYNEQQEPLHDTPQNRPEDDPATASHTDHGPEVQQQTVDYAIAADHPADPRSEQQSEYAGHPQQQNEYGESTEDVEHVAQCRLDTPEAAHSPQGPHFAARDRSQSPQQDDRRSQKSSRRLPLTIIALLVIGVACAIAFRPYWDPDVPGDQDPMHDHAANGSDLLQAPAFDPAQLIGADTANDITATNDPTNDSVVESVPTNDDTADAYPAVSDLAMTQVSPEQHQFPVSGVLSYEPDTLPEPIDPGYSPSVSPGVYPGSEYPLANPLAPFNMSDPPDTSDSSDMLYPAANDQPDPSSSELSGMIGVEDPPQVGTEPESQYIGPSAPVGTPPSGEPYQQQPSVYPPSAYPQQPSAYQQPPAVYPSSAYPQPAYSRDAGSLVDHVRDVELQLIATATGDALFALPAGTTKWMLADSAVVPNTSYATPGGFDAQFRLNNGLVLDFLDGARIRFLPTDPQNPKIVNLAVDEGRVVITWDSDPASPVNQLPPTARVVRLHLDQYSRRFEPSDPTEKVDLLEATPRRGTLTLPGPGTAVEVAVCIHSLPSRPEDPIQRLYNKYELRIGPGIDGSAVQWRNELSMDQRPIEVRNREATIEVLATSESQLSDTLTPGVPDIAFQPELQLPQDVAKFITSEVRYATDLSSKLVELYSNHPNENVRRAAVNALWMTQQLKLLEPGSRFTLIDMTIDRSQPETYSGNESGSSSVTPSSRIARESLTNPDYRYDR